MAPPESSSSPLPLYNFPLTQECEDLLRTLPSENSPVWPRTYHYHGFWFFEHHLNGLLSCRSNFQTRDDDVILATMPKSGTTWLMAILFALSHRACPFTTNPRQLVPLLETNLYLDNPNPDLSSFTCPRIFASHIPYALLPKRIRDSKCKIVYLCRNLKDNFTSLWHFVNKLRPNERGEDALEEAFDKFCQGVNPFGPCWDHVLGYWKASLEMPERILFLKYEDVKTRPVETVKRLAEFIGCPFDEDEDEGEAANEILRMCSLEFLSKLEVNKNGKLRIELENKVFFRKGEVGDWINLLTSEMADRLDRITEEKLNGSGLKL